MWVPHFCGARCNADPSLTGFRPLLRFVILSGAKDLLLPFLCTTTNRGAPSVTRHYRGMGGKARRPQSQTVNSYPARSAARLSIPQPCKYSLNYCKHSQNNLFAFACNFKASSHNGDTAGNIECRNVSAVLHSIRLDEPFLQVRKTWRKACQN